MVLFWPDLSLPASNRITRPDQCQSTRASPARGQCAIQTARRRYLGQAVAKSPFKQTIDRAVMQWMQYRVNAKMPGLVIPSVDELLKRSDMLEENIGKWRAKAVAEGMLLGKLEGRLEGGTTLLEHQLMKRFGPISVSTHARLKAATEDQLQTWAERILDAHSLTEVFSDH